MSNINHQMSKMITRFAPSPTGSFHIGSARTALFNFLAARHYGGRMILRIEDTDSERSKKEYEDEIIEGLEWLGITYEEIYRQSERGEVYKNHIEKLLSLGAAYESQEERGSVIRFKNPGTKVSFTDIVRGEITFDTKELGDFVIARNRTEPLYHLAVVIDDFESGITHVIRGEDHISNTPRQILIQEAIGAPRPEYVHIPLVLAPDKSKLSKRTGAEPIKEYREEGYLPSALVNFLAFLGWSPSRVVSKGGKEEEIFTIDELIREFSFEHIQASGAIFNKEKLDWFNREHIKRLPDAELLRLVQSSVSSVLPKVSGVSEKVVTKMLPLFREHITTLGDIRRLVKEEMQFFYATPHYENKEKLIWKDTGVLPTKKHIDNIINILSSIDPRDFTKERTKDAVWEYATAKGRGAVLWPMRYALSGREKSPDPFVIAEILGKDETIERLRRALEELKEQ